MYNLCEKILKEINIIYSYKELKKLPDTISATEADQILKSILESKNFNNHEIKQHWDEFVKLAGDYINFRGHWSLFSYDEQKKHDNERSICHNKCMHELKLIASLLEKQGDDISWFTFRDNRKKFGDVICYVAYLYSLNGR
ncbi:hypothetical protein ASN88_01156 [Streptococcus parauberis]|nr:hypothetical protein ASN88_01156 [Streptococcus parauberis]